MCGKVHVKWCRRWLNSNNNSVNIPINLLQCEQHRSRWRRRKAETCPAGSMLSGTWSAPPRPRMVFGMCLRWPPGRRCRCANAKTEADARCCEPSTYPANSLSNKRKGGKKIAEKDWPFSSVFVLCLVSQQQSGRTGSKCRKWTLSILQPRLELDV